MASATLAFVALAAEPKFEDGVLALDSEESFAQALSQYPNLLVNFYEPEE